MEYRIFPPIGVCRLGNSSDHFLGPEVLGSHGRESGPGGEVEIVHFKDATFRVKKQAARFRVFQQLNPGDEFVPAVLPAGATIQWTVHLANKKDAIERQLTPPATIPSGGLRPVLDATRTDRLIDAGVQTISGANAASVDLIGQHVGVPVKLGQISTDADGNLIVLGGSGISNSHPSSTLSDFYKNPDWHDDVADGPVSAQINFGDGTTANAGSAWAISAPPDFAPAAEAVVTLYDVIYQLATSQTWLPKPTTTSFTKDIYPLLRKARSLQWAHGARTPSGSIQTEVNWQKISDDYAALADKATPNAAALRQAQVALILKIENGVMLRQYALTATIREHLQRWAAGNFAEDWVGPPAVAAQPTAQSLTQAQLDGCAGQGFFPGIEAGRMVLDRTIYLQPFDFRIDITKLTAGDMTALMAQPWQADFLDCRKNWWPSQRPDIAPQAGGGTKLWARIGTRDDTPAANSLKYEEIVQHVMQFGVIEPRSAGGHATGVEEGRDPAIL